MAAVLSCMAAAPLSAKPGAAAKKGEGGGPRKLNFYMLKQEGLGGEGEGTLLVTVRKTVKAIADVTGYKIEFVYADSAAMGEAIDTGAADLFMWGSESYSYEKDNFLRRYAPLAAMSIHGKKTHRYCIYVSEKKGYTGLADLAGGRLHVQPYWVGYGHITEFLRDAGITKPPAAFWGEILVSDNVANSFIKLKTGEADAVFGQTDEAGYALLMNSELKKIAPLVCSGEYTNVPILYNKSIPPEQVANIKKTLLSSHRNKAFREVLAMFSAAKMRFVPAEKHDYDKYKAHFGEGWRRGDFQKVFDAISLRGIDEAYRKPGDIFKGRNPGFVELEKMLGWGDFKNAEKTVRRLARESRDPRMKAVAASVEALASGQAMKKTAGRKCPANMVYVPAGEFRMGSSDPARFGEKRMEKVTLKAYCIDIYEYPNVKHIRPRPVVSRTEAQALCKAQGKRLPSEAEWEKAARGTRSRIYPWGNRWETRKANAAGAADGFAAAAPAGSFPLSASPYGAQDMAGNLWEIAFDWNVYGDAGKLTGAETVIILRGGSWMDGPMSMRASFRNPSFNPGEAETYGFRCVKD